MQLVVALGNAFLVCFAFDAGLSLLEEGLRAATGSTALMPYRQGLAFGALLFGAPALALTALSPQLPGRLVLPLVLSLLWLNFGAAPLPLWLSPSALGPVAASIQLAIAAAALVWVRRRSPTGGFLLVAREALPAWSIPRAAGFAAGILLLGPPLAVGYLLLSLLTWMELGTAGFMRFGSGGLSMAEVRYQRDDRRVDLVGMMHLGERDAYASLYESFATPSTVVLQEGVTDREQRLAVPLRYAGVAESLGLSEQEPIELYFEEAWGEIDEGERWPHIWRADLDTSAFAPETIAFIEKAARLWSADEVSALPQLWLELSRDPVDVELLMGDIIVLRNEHLLEELQRALQGYERVVVPWGALHLPAVEEALLAQGFERGHESTRLLVSWASLLSGLAGLLDADGQGADAAEVESVEEAVDGAGADAEDAPPGT